VVEAYRGSLAPDRRTLLDGYRFREIARKVVGSAASAPALVILMTGPGERDPLFLQAKEAGASVLEPYAGASDAATHGQRVVEGRG